MPPWSSAAGQNVNSYGGKEAGEISFAELLCRVHEVAGVERIRFTTSHPKDLSDELIDCFCSLPKLCSQLQLPVQAGSDRILQQMNRGYTRAQYLAKVERLKLVCPEIRLTTDLIVGFPGETEADFQQTLEIVRQVRYADAYTFLYSPRPGTAAAELDDPVSALEKQRWFDQLLEVQTAINREIWAGDIGSTVEVLVEGESKQKGGQLFGRSVWGRIVNFAGDPALIGTLVKVRINRSLRNSQLGELVLAAAV
jgi:tRNA-2-methylthio-N6-dimethylallyladenosine synthase